MTGKTYTVNAPASLHRSLSTLRAFPDLRKNCYDISIPGGGQVLVRMWFYYGNYDGKSSPPKFGLIFDGNMWGTVSASSDEAVQAEAVYVINGDATSVCVAQTEQGQVPFVSAIEVTSLDSDMYPGVSSDRALFTRNRMAYGAPSIVRYPDDPYDRIWTPATGLTGLTKLKNDASTITVDSTTDKPPEAVLQTAVSDSDASSPLTFTNITSSTTPTEIYINLYFTEMSELASTEKRSFKVFVDETAISDAISPPYQSAVEFNFTIKDMTSANVISLRPTSNSTLAPIISASELFRISDPLNKTTYSNDVDALVNLQRQIDVLGAWTGDPCLPALYNWEWVGCSSDEKPRVTSLDLSEGGFSGILPDFSDLDALEKIDLHNNSFSGLIPEFFGNFPNLKELNLADNDFSGPIPSSLINNKKLKLDVSGNPNLCQSNKDCATSSSTSYSSGASSDSVTDQKKKKKKSHVGVIVGTVVPVFMVFWVVVGLIVYSQQKKRAALKAGGVTHGAPNFPMQERPLTVPSVQASPLPGDQVTVEIAQQMGSELSDLMEQHARAEAEGNANHDTHNAS
ncbi:Uncharacterized protein QJS10_CPB13g00535 [Acorus calamus]|uniref:Malectin-like domain-containing protein n=1 Tax=Acorus calamus TaxID=4465 RepID=A0AAV9DIC3_ACOCL|nr:Uncharacterized protein QJS10_CPB13g00535 [Acorus calamus]